MLSLAQVIGRFHAQPTVPVNIYHKSQQVTLVELEKKVLFSSGKKFRKRTMKEMMKVHSENVKSANENIKLIESKLQDKNLTKREKFLHRKNKVSNRTQVRLQTEPLVLLQQIDMKNKRFFEFTDKLFQIINNKERDMIQQYYGFYKSSNCREGLQQQFLLCDDKFDQLW